jgi:hypothetical protein
MTNMLRLLFTRSSAALVVKRLLWLFALVVPMFGAAQNGTWTWISGDTLSSSAGNFGVQGVPAPSNMPHQSPDLLIYN